MVEIKRNTEYWAKRSAIYHAVNHFRMNKSHNEKPVKIIWEDMYGNSSSEIVYIRREILSTIFRVDIVDFEKYLKDSSLWNLTREEVMEGWDMLRKHQLRRRRKRKLWIRIRRKKE